MMGERITIPPEPRDREVLRQVAASHGVAAGDITVVPGLGGFHGPLFHCTCETCFPVVTAKPAAGEPKFLSPPVAMVAAHYGFTPGDVWEVYHGRCEACGRVYTTPPSPAFSEGEGTR